MVASALSCAVMNSPPTSCKRCSMSVSAIAPRRPRVLGGSMQEPIPSAALRGRDPHRLVRRARLGVDPFGVSLLSGLQPKRIASTLQVRRLDEDVARTARTELWIIDRPLLHSGNPLASEDLAHHLGLGSAASACHDPWRSLLLVVVLSHQKGSVARAIPSPGERVWGCVSNHPLEKGGPIQGRGKDVSQ
jgi:hypothetical protein